MQVVLHIGNYSGALYSIKYGQFNENASDQSFNESKFYGTVCDYLINNGYVILQNAEEGLSKKGTHPIMYYINSRIPNKNVIYILVCNKNKISKKSNSERLYNLATSNKFKIVDNAESEDNFLEPIILEDNTCKYTCGIIASYKHKGNIINGHVTRDYGIDVNRVNELKSLNQRYFNKEYNGTIIHINVGGKFGGSIVYIPELDENENKYSHITVNTKIKSSLSKEIIQNYLNNNFEFNIKTIDSSAKNDVIININNEVENIKVNTQEWYRYIVQ